MADYYIAVVLDLSGGGVTDSDADVGLDTGVFYWIVGRPGYAGSGYSAMPQLLKPGSRESLEAKKALLPPM